MTNNDLFGNDDLINMKVRGEVSQKSVLRILKLGNIVKFTKQLRDYYFFRPVRQYLFILAKTPTYVLAFLSFSAPK